MAYGNGNSRKKWLRRAIPLGIGKLSDNQRKQFFTLRTAVLQVMRDMVTQTFIQEPLGEYVGGKELDGKLLVIQKSEASCAINSVWREQARMRVKPALDACYARYYQRLSGSLFYVDQKIPEKEKHEDEPLRIFFNIPESVQNTITPEEIAGIKAIAESGKSVAVFRSLILNNDTQGFSEAQITVLRFIHTRTQEKHRPPEFGIKENFTLQLHLDARMLSSKQKLAAADIQGGIAYLLEDRDNRQYHRFLDISGVAPRSPRLRVPVVLASKMAKRVADTVKDGAALILEISESTIGTRLVVAKAPTEPEAQPGTVRAFVGRDFGYVNTGSFSVAVADHDVDISAMQAVLAELQDKVAVQTYVESHALPGDVRIVDRVRYSGRAFLKRIADLTKRIDAYKSRIDKTYALLDAVKAEIVSGLKLEADDLITPEMKAGPMGDRVREFFRIFGLIQDLKQERRKLYRQIAALKKNWFGFLANAEVELARKHHAAIVREDLTVEAIEKDDPEYKGRTFNKMINNGSKGQYQRRASQTFRWNGVPEVVIPSWYTSRSCLPHSVIIEKKHRKGESIFLPCCGVKDHADEHAADTIACYPFLVAKAGGIGLST
jgi:hypothetical protein